MMVLSDLRRYSSLKACRIIIKVDCIKNSIWSTLTLLGRRGGEGTKTSAKDKNRTKDK
jgi:hypothetical protein